MPGKRHPRVHNLCLLGFGNVNRTLVRLLQDRELELRDKHGIAWRITGVATRRLGWIASRDGLDALLLAGNSAPRWDLLPHVSPPYGNVRDWLHQAHADVLFEATSLNAHTGQPAIDHLRTALDSEVHAITANKGPLVYAYEELTRLAAAKGRRFLFESTVMDGVPIFSLFRDSLPTVHVRGFRGILNSTTNLILTGMEEGLSFEESLKKAQDVGVAETDPSDDIDGWDGAVKVAALVCVVMRMPLKLDQIQREGIRGLSGETVRAARRAGTPYKLVCRAASSGNAIQASVRPEQVPLSDPLAHVTGSSSVVYFETDTFPGLAITEDNPGLEATAYGMLADFIRAVSK
ncbi:MAG: homoserine dehydrogenase [Acidobacteria bacterium]|nr:MAG: homoserine dehydrogenase [Acidobacteriota bacterium]PYY10135.1 MAG: homoserine dehydrogenase [Acidobacteriota bacterium]